MESRLYQDPSALQNISWPGVNWQLDQNCPDILHVVDLILCILASTVDREQGFSAMKLVKSDWWTSLKSQTLSDLLTAVFCFHRRLLSSPSHQVCGMLEASGLKGQLSWISLSPSFSHSHSYINTHNVK